MSPNTITILGTVISAGVGMSIAYGHWIAAFIGFILAGICDVMDGRVARSRGQVTRFGALLDSSLDRYSDAFYYFGFILYYLNVGNFVYQSHFIFHDKIINILFAASGLIAAFEISYVRARAEALELRLYSGFWERPERIALMMGGILFRNTETAIVLLGTLPHITAAARIFHCGRGTAGAVKNRREIPYIVQWAAIALVVLFFRF
jgi:CDP-diacylglycerol--glycerol-3-phosphate 3-phosphatidyltransferase